MKITTWFGILLCSSSYSVAQEKLSLAPMSICQGQIDLYCKSDGTKPDVRQTVKCLMKNDEKLTTECKQEIQRFVQASQQTSPVGGGPLGALGGIAGPGSQVPSISYEGRYVPAPERNSLTPSFNETNLNASFPLYKTEAYTVSTTLGGSILRLSAPVLLESGKMVPNDLYRTEVGLQFSQKLQGARMFGIRGSLGYTGDKVHSSTESFSISANYSIPGKESTYWIAMVYLSNNSALGTFVPIPGFFYIYKTPTFTGLFGLPVLSMQWTPVNPWAFSFSAFGPQLKAEVAYGPIDQSQVYAGLSWKQQRYMLSERTNEDERLTFEEKTAELGYRKPFMQGLFLDLQAGYAFDRLAYAGDGLFKKEAGQTTFDSNWFLKWSVKAAF